MTAPRPASWDSHLIGPPSAQIANSVKRRRLLPAPLEQLLAISLRRSWNSQGRRCTPCHSTGAGGRPYRRPRWALLKGRECHSAVRLGLRWRPRSCSWHIPVGARWAHRLRWISQLGGASSLHELTAMNYGNFAALPPLPSLQRQSA